MQRVLTLSTDDQIRLAFLQWGYLNGAEVERQKLAREQRTQARQDRKSEGRIDRAIKSLGAPDPNAPEPKPDASGLMLDRRPLVLNATGGEIRLEQEDFERLKRYVDQAPWLQDLSYQVGEFQDWLEAAPPAKDA